MNVELRETKLTTIYSVLCRNCSYHPKASGEFYREYCGEAIKIM